MIGVAVVSLFTVVAASLTQSIDDAIDGQFAGELVITGEGRGGLSTDLAPPVAELPEVAAASPVGGAPVRIDGRDGVTNRDAPSRRLGGGGPPSAPPTEPPAWDVLAAIVTE